MQITLESNDIEQAIKNYLKKEFNLDKELKIEYTSKRDGGITAALTFGNLPQVTNSKAEVTDSDPDADIPLDKPEETNTNTNSLFGH